MRERPIILRAHEVRGILDGRVTQVRRPVKRDLTGKVLRQSSDGTWDVVQHRSRYSSSTKLGCPFGSPGDRLWVREAWGLHRHLDESDWNRTSIAGMADAAVIDRWTPTYRADWGPNQEGAFWRPSIHMPRWASRLTLTVADVRVERVQDISEADAIAEGIDRNDVGEWLDYPAGSSAAGWRDPRESFASLWRSTYGAESWDANPWTWVVSFDVEVKR